MSDYTVVNVKDGVEDMAQKFGYSPQLESRFCRVPPEITRGFEAGAEGAELIVAGAPNTENRDVEMLPGWWTG